MTSGNSNEDFSQPTLICAKRLKEQPRASRSALHNRETTNGAPAGERSPWRKTPGADPDSAGMIDGRLESDDRKARRRPGWSDDGPDEHGGVVHPHSQAADLLPSLREGNSCAPQRASAQLCETFASVTDNRLWAVTRHLTSALQL